MQHPEAAHLSSLWVFAQKPFPILLLRVCSGYLWACPEGCLTKVLGQQINL